MTSKQKSRSFIWVPIDFSYTTSYRLSIVTFALATILHVTDDRQTDATLYQVQSAKKMLRYNDTWPIQVGQAYTNVKKCQKTTHINGIIIKYRT